MEKRCFVIMPKSNPEGYAQGHFNRVFQCIIIPACRFAGFSPIRADDLTSSETPLDMLQTIIDSDMVICDLSAKNSHALYGLAIRQALNLPVVLIRDMKTKMVDIQEIEYDESLRIDTVEKEIETLSKALNETFANKAETNLLLSRLNIGTASLTGTKTAADMVTSTSTDDDDNAKKREKHLPVISPLPDYVGDPITQQEIDTFKIGDALFHMNYGKGEIKVIRKAAGDKIATVHFGSESKLLVLVTSGIFRKIKA